MSLTADSCWTETYKVTSFLVNLRGQAGLSTILSFIQDVGWQHAIHLKIKLPQNQGWVFTRQKLSMKKWPAWSQEVRIATWLRPPDKGPFLYRDYEIFVGDDKIGVCTSSFSAMDMQQRKLANVDWSGFPPVWRREGLLDVTPEKIPPRADAIDLAQFQVRNSDIDLNHHVNNTKYSQWILDALPIEVLSGKRHLQGFDVNFLAEAKTGDIIKIQYADPDASKIFFQGLRLVDGKPVFTAYLETGDSP